MQPLDLIKEYEKIYSVKSLYEKYIQTIECVVIIDCECKNFEKHQMKVFVNYFLKNVVSGFVLITVCN